ncbi:hypothetical protein MHA_0786 [Mannheimia haemolytica PHL213]|nr:hypothetical protein MHA_0786 [Mannheimia haemolytica PHL213]
MLCFTTFRLFILNLYHLYSIVIHKVIHKRLYFMVFLQINPKYETILPF